MNTNSIYAKLIWQACLRLCLISIAIANCQAATITISCAAVGQEYELCKQGAEAWAKQTHNEVKIANLPDSSSERLALYQKMLEAGDKSVDVLQVDVVWPGLLAEHLLDLKRYTSAELRAGFFDSMLRNGTVKGKLLALPWYTDAGLLYYRKDLLQKYKAEIPGTWEAMSSTATRIQAAERAAGQSKLWGYVWQGNAYEGLTCNALEWLLSYKAGAIVTPDGKLNINNPKATLALAQAATWVGTISPPQVLEFREEEARKMFQSGDAVFMRNWPYAWQLLNKPDSPVKDKVGVTLLPKGGEDGRHAAILGGLELAVSRYSKQPDLAASLVLYLTSAQEQKRRAIVGGYNPTIAQLYFDMEVLAANPFFGSLPEVFSNTYSRPSAITGKVYSQVSKEFWSSVHNTIAGQSGATDSLKALEGRLQPLARNGSW